MNLRMLISYFDIYPVLLCLLSYYSYCTYIAVSIVVLYCREIPKLKQRIAGKSIPIEKFAVNKAKRYQDQNGYLTLPALVSLNILF